MMRTIVCGAAAVLLLSVSNPAAAQSAKSLVGSWASVSSITTDGAGSKSDTFGANPRGMLVFARGLREAPDDPDLDFEFRANLALWRSRMLSVRGAFAHKRHGSRLFLIVVVPPRCSGRPGLTLR